MRNGRGSLAFGLLISIVGLCPLASPGDARAEASDVTVDVAIDVNTIGNGDNVLGPTESCNETPLQVGYTIDVDVVVRGVPSFDPVAKDGGAGGFILDLLFDPGVLQLDEIYGYDGPTILNGGLPPSVRTIDYNFNGHGDSKTEDPPGTVGDALIGLISAGPQVLDGDGVLTRVTMRGIASGVSYLGLSNTVAGEDTPDVTDARLDKYGIVKSGAQIVVSAGKCSAPPAQTRAPTARATPAVAPGLGGPPVRSTSAWPMVGGALALTISAAFAIARRRL